MPVNTRVLRLAAYAFFAATIAAMSVSAAAQTPSTPEERTRLVSLAHKLETNPLDTTLESDRGWAIKWLIEVPDIHVSICPLILGDFHKYKYSTQINEQLALSSAAFVIENPGKSSDRIAQYLAAAQGALKAYSSILQQNPKAKSKPLDDALQKQSDGQLRAFVEDAVAKHCDH